MASLTVHTIVLTGLVFTANNYPDTYVYNLGDILWDIEKTSDNINKTTTNSTQAPSNFTNMKGISESPQSFGNAVLHSLFDGYNLSSTALVQNLPLLNGLYICILCNIVLHAVLFFFQVWKPFKEDEAESKKEVDMEEEHGNNKEKTNDCHQSPYPQGNDDKESFVFSLLFPCSSSISLSYSQPHLL